MAESAFQVQYRQEYIHGFEARQSLLRGSVTTEAVIKGNQATFLIATSGGATTTTRGLNGLIPARADSLTQVTATLTEEHDLARKSGFNVFASQGNQRAIMQATSMAVVNRTVDAQIITQLNTGTVTPSATAVPITQRLVGHAKAILGVNEVPFDGNLFGLITPAAETFMCEIEAFANSLYTGKTPIPDAELAWDDKQKYYIWMGVKWIVHPNLPGVGTSAEKCFMFHRNAIGHAIDMSGLQARAGYDEEQDYSWCRTSGYMGAKLLQNSGVVVINHDGSGLAAA